MLITGAARGLGAGLARACAAQGARVALLGLEPDALAALAADLGRERAAWWEVDVTDGPALGAAVAAAAEHFGGLDVVVANAGITAFAPVATLAPEVFERVVAVNLTGVWRTLRAGLPYVTARDGYLLAISSLAAVLQSPLQAHYTATKAGVAALAQSLALELKGTGTRVGCAYPTFVRTDMMRRTLADPAGARLWRGNRGGMFTMVSEERAVRALRRGIERRARRIVIPRLLTPVVLAPGLAQPVFAARFRPRAVQAAMAAASPDGWARGS